MLANGKFVMALVMLAIFVVMVLMSLAYPPDSRLLPLVIGIPGILLALVQVVQEYLAASRRGMALAAGTEGKSDGESLLPVRTEVVLYGYLIGLSATILLFGFWLTIPFFLVVFLRFQSGAGWKLVALLTAGGWGVLYVVFDLMLGIIPHTGFLTDYLMD